MSGKNDDLIDLSKWASLPEDAYAEKVWSLLEERAFGTLTKESVTINEETSGKTPGEWESGEVAVLSVENTESEFELYHPSRPHQWFKKYIYNKESLLYYETEDVDGHTILEPFEDPSALQLWFKKYIYNFDYVFYYPQNDAGKESSHPSEKPSLLQKWYRTYVYNPAYNELIKLNTSVKTTANSTQGLSKTPWRKTPSSHRPKNKGYIRSNGYRYTEEEEIFSLPPLPDRQQKDKRDLQEEMHYLFPEYFDGSKTESEKEETDIWGEPIPRF